jgi:hypothetical protein
MTKNTASGKITESLPFPYPTKHPIFGQLLYTMVLQRLLNKAYLNATIKIIVVIQFSPFRILFRRF